ncbi:hypothetical protein CHS0354_024262 [Potamilus streckersoni]|uniref:Flavin-containing monooxygenase n=1 Tax=Potamilus streckersoni TaxID=2493646 RepID=A0AAE0SM98_9BIVA|nr:hypothetical protein CHS0354_024262 [Potamilus streckersoni]
MARRCCVIGAGVSGLAALKECLDSGLDPVCFDMDADLGGLWNAGDKPKAGFPFLYKSCVTNTSKTFTCFSDFPIPKEYPNFMRCSHFKAYLDSYAVKFKLRNYIRFKTKIIGVKRADDFLSSGRWKVTSKHLETGHVTEETFDYVMICNGHYYEPMSPHLPGLQEFTGKTIHSHDYIDFHGYEGKKVLVVGFGNSAGDIACELSQHAQHVCISTRRGGYCVPRAGDYGVPYDYISLAGFTQYIPSSYLLPLVLKKINNRYDHTKYSIAPNAPFSPGTIIVNDDLPNKILIGAVSMKGEIKNFTKDGVVFEDGTKELFEAVVFATGYHFSFPFLEDSVITMDTHFPSLYEIVFPADLEPCTLAVIGLTQPNGPLIPVVELQSRWACRVFRDYCQLPSVHERKKEIAERKNAVIKLFYDSPRHANRINLLYYCDKIAGYIGCRANLWKVFREDIKIWKLLVFGPAGPARWRLQGPGKWDGAVQEIKSTEEKMLFPLKTRVAGIGERDGLYAPWIRVVYKLLAIVFLIVAVILVIG